MRGRQNGVGDGVRPGEPILVQPEELAAGRHQLGVGGKEDRLALLEEFLSASTTQPMHGDDCIEVVLHRAFAPVADGTLEHPSECILINKRVLGVPRRGNDPNLVGSKSIGQFGDNELDVGALESLLSEVVPDRR
jgi:hypothetical protein